MHQAYPGASLEVSPPNGALLEVLHPASGMAGICCIVTNDRFLDCIRRGGVDAAWVDDHGVRYAFGPVQERVRVDLGFGWSSLVS